MSKPLKVTADYLLHDGGTKFYETVLIEHPDGPTMLIKRWGAIAKKHGGGQAKIERGTRQFCVGERDKILGEKKTPRSGKGVYEESAIRWGFHDNFSGGSRSTGAFTGEELVNKATAHWKDDDATRLAIARHFAIDIDLPDPGEFDDVVDETMIEEEAAPIDRGAEWASW